MFSDSHGETALLERALGAEHPSFQRIVHLGDGLRDMESVRDPGVPVLQVRGNMDLSDVPATEMVTEIDGVRVFLTHGHQYRAHATLELLKARAVRSGARLALFGHTHRPENTLEDGVLYFNPGALKHGSYGTVVLDNGAIRDARHRTVRRS